MSFEEVMLALEAHGDPKTKRIYAAHGAREPHFGVAVADLRALAKKIKKNHALAERLYASGNYDAMHLAAMVADSSAMTEADFERWMQGAYFFILSDYSVATLLSRTAFAQSVADRWIQSGEELRMSAGYTCYSLMLATLADESFDRAKLLAMLEAVTPVIHQLPSRARYAANAFIIALGVSYLPLHDEAMRAAERVGKVRVVDGKTVCQVPLATEYIQKAERQGKLGYKRKSPPC